MLDLTAKEFPGNVVFIAAVGAHNTPDEKYLVLITNKDQIFLAPGNGLITYVVKDKGREVMPS